MKGHMPDKQPAHSGANFPLSHEPTLLIPPPCLNLQLILKPEMPFILLLTHLSPPSFKVQLKSHLHHERFFSRPQDLFYVEAPSWALITRSLPPFIAT